MIGQSKVLLSRKEAKHKSKRESNELNIERERVVCETNICVTKHARSDEHFPYHSLFSCKTLGRLIFLTSKGDENQQALI